MKDFRFHLAGLLPFYAPAVGCNAGIGQPLISVKNRLTILLHPAATLAFGVVIAFLMATFLLPAPAHSQSEKKNSFFKEGSVQDIFGKNVEEVGQSELEYFVPIKPTMTPEPEPDVEQPVGKKDKKSEEIDPKKTKYSSVEDLKKAFGDGADDPPVLPQGEAPQPFVAMMQAMELGDEDLAFQYAKQYVRYRERQKKAMKMIMALQGLAMEREGLLDEEGWQRSAEYEEYRPILERDLAKEVDKKTKEDQDQKAKIEGSQGIGGERVDLRADESKGEFDLFARAKRLTDKAATLDARESMNQTPASVPTISPEEERSRLAHQVALRGKVPVDPEGKVDIFFFFQAEQGKSKQMGQVVERLYRRFLPDSRVTVVGLSMDSSNTLDVERFTRSVGAGFPTQPGSFIATQLKITEAPVMLFRSPNTGGSFIERGVKDLSYLEAVVKSMQGEEG